MPNQSGLFWTYSYHKESYFILLFQAFIHSSPSIHRVSLFSYLYITTTLLWVFFWHLLLLLLLLILFWGLLWPPMDSKLNSLWVQPHDQFPLGPHLGHAIEIYLQPVCSPEWWLDLSYSISYRNNIIASSASTPIWLHFNKGQPISCMPENNKQHLGNSIVIGRGFSFIWL